MSSTHLAKGSTLPPNTGKLRVYNMRFCPYAQRLILVLNAKNIDYEVINIDLMDKPDWFLSINPSGKVPVLEVAENVTLYESLLSAEYVDEKYPQNPLFSKDPLKKAQDKLIIENFNKRTGAWYKAVLKNIDAFDYLMQGLEETENALVNRGTSYFHGDKPGMVDYMIWPWFERFDLVVKYCGEKFVLGMQKFKALSTWVELMKQDPVVKSYYLEPDVHDEYIRLRLAGKNPFRSSL